jgi:putative ABC transport system substrate-binding protein
MLLGGAAAWARAARAQQPAMPVIGFLNTRALGDDPSLIAAFRLGLKEGGFVEGQNVAIEYRFADNKNDRLPELAADLVRREVAVIVAPSGIAAALAAKTATTTIPIAFRVGVDPVQAGLASSMNRPDGNATGVTTLGTELGPKRLELLHEFVPTAAVVAILVNPTNPSAERASKDLQAAALTLGLQTHIVQASSEHHFDAVFATLVRVRAGGLVISADNFFVARAIQLAALGLRHGVPMIDSSFEFAAAGGLMGYGSSVKEAYRLVGGYTGRILKGEKPAELPIQQSTKVELTINLKTAKALGLTVPLSLLGRADEVIE